MLLGGSSYCRLCLLAELFLCNSKGNTQSSGFNGWMFLPFWTIESVPLLKPLTKNKEQVTPLQVSLSVLPLWKPLSRF